MTWSGKTLLKKQWKHVLWTWLKSTKKNVTKKNITKKQRNWNLFYMLKKEKYVLLYTFTYAKESIKNILLSTFYISCKFHENLRKTIS